MGKQKKLKVSDLTVTVDGIYLNAKDVINVKRKKISIKKKFLKKIKGNYCFIEIHLPEIKFENNV